MRVAVLRLHVLLLVLFLLLAAHPAAFAQTPAEPTSPPTPEAPDAPQAAMSPRVYIASVGYVTSGASLSTLEQQVVDLTNQARVQSGCAPLAVDQALVSASRGHSGDMAANDFFSHTGSDGSSPFDRMQDAGYRFSTAAENIAAGYDTPATVVSGWLNSAGHRANILNCDLHEIGVGYAYDGGSAYRHYWTQDFGTP